VDIQVLELEVMLRLEEGYTKHWRIPQKHPSSFVSVLSPAVPPAEIPSTDLVAKEVGAEDPHALFQTHEMNPS
jgi:hypothetical protein